MTKYFTNQSINIIFFFNFSIWVFPHKHSRLPGQQVKGEAISLTSLYHLHSIHRHLDISWVITAESSPRHIVSSQAPTGILCFRAQVANH